MIFLSIAVVAATALYFNALNIYAVIAGIAIATCGIWDR